MDMSNHPLLAAGLDDPPPFPASYPQLRRLDRSLYCQICKEPFQAPVSIACGHSFCSSCIRSSLDVTKKCPTCGETAGEGSIRRNRILEEITDAWEESRPTLITLTQPQPTRKRPPPEPHPKASSSSSNGLKRSRLGSTSRSASPFKRDSPPEEQPEEEEDEVIELRDNDLAPCPLCGAEMAVGNIPMHIERGCPPPKQVKAIGSGNQKADWKKVFAGAGMGKGKEVEMKRITKPNYSLATPADLKGILTEYGLPTTGDKAALESRVQEWIILWNANLDTSHPKSLPSLRSKLTEAEASRKRDKEKGKDALVSSLGTTEGLNKYAEQKRGEFDRMRREIMERDKKRRESGDAGNARNSPIEVD